MASLFGQASTPTRPLILHSVAARVSIPVAASPLPAWVASEVLAQEFHDSRAAFDDSEPAIEVDEDDAEDAASRVPSTEPQVKLLARFLSFASDKVNAAPSDELAQVLVAAFERFNELFLRETDVHALVQAYDPEQRVQVLKAYYKAFTTARKASGANVKLASPSALLQAAKNGQAELYALFGGQGVNEVSA